MARNIRKTSGVSLKKSGTTIYYHCESARQGLAEVANSLGMKFYESGYGFIFPKAERSDLSTLVEMVNDEGGWK